MATRTLNLIKADHRYVFRYTPDGAEQIMNEITRLARDPAAHLDWLDAATLALQVTSYVASDCRETIGAPLGAER